MKKKDESLGFAIYAVAKSSIAQSTWQQISIATLGSSGSVQKGDAAVVLGKPFGYAGAVGFGTIASSRNELTVMTEVIRFFVQTLVRQRTGQV